jgi:hypothetical protein
VLEGAVRLIVEEPLLAVLGVAEKDPAPQGADLGAEALAPLRKAHLKGPIAPRRFRNRRGVVAWGVDAAALPGICEVWLEARNRGVAARGLGPAAEAAELLVRAFAREGVIALVDEATGYRYDSQRKELARQLEPLVMQPLCRWVAAFPPDYFRELSRLRGVPPGAAAPITEDAGRHTLELVFRRMAPELLLAARAQAAAGATEEGAPSNFLPHIGMVIGLMKVSADWDALMGHLNAAAPRGLEETDLKSQPN